MRSDASQLDYRGRVAIVTGSGRGLGRDYALMLASRGARVVVNGRRRKPVDDVVAEIRAAGGEAVADDSDVSTDGPRLVQAALDAYGRLDVVINNAGIARAGLLAEADPAEWWKVFDIHVKGTVEVSRAAWPHLVASQTGCLINTASPAMLGEAGLSAYNAAKGAIWGLSNALAAEGARVGVRVATILPIAWTPPMERAPWDPQVRDTFHGRFAARRVAAFVAWLAHQGTTLTAETLCVGAGRVVRMAFAGQPAVQVADDSPEAWASVADATAAPAATLTPFADQGALVGHELVAVNPELAAVLARDGSPTTRVMDATLR
jgi:NAD(P)-dependent dehydrogenase (short-subunit alcohol dehydrogenase family)